MALESSVFWILKSLLHRKVVSPSVWVSRTQQWPVMCSTRRRKSNRYAYEEKSSFSKDMRSIFFHANDRSAAVEASTCTLP